MVNFKQLVLSTFSNPLKGISDRNEIRTTFRMFHAYLYDKIWEVLAGPRH